MTANEEIKRWCPLKTASNRSKTAGLPDRTGGKWIDSGWGFS
jgi:hypothetical protein